ncbi:sialidase family protein [Ohessyouella blattaphilus]|uniref:Glycoside hydrolase n=1 Tax=Ohessyouella blattaphilus TaxID=2949333 RepID=A0ABT1EIK0_9FIRM|nr:sialidase family protein [Ohessyouella blattaphilus]MCP1110531.1 glycoside hydrolase [Ohessyouella blattaphilus]MCR8563925.1 glycoside hydrolase [Ohessyouella blattaphilus]
MPNESTLTPAKIYVNAAEERFQDTYRRWQGIPSIEVSAKGRIFVNFYAGQDAEVGGNIMVLCISDDHGESFRSCATVIEHPDPEVRIYDPNLWITPHGILWMTYTQARGFNDGRSGVWLVTCDNPDADILSWSTPRRIANGIMMNKPTVSSKGEWLFPCAIWCDTSGSIPTERHGLENEQFSNVYASTDEGRTITLRGHADVPDRGFDEHMIVEKNDGTLWMLVRTLYGIGESFSTDGGYTWSHGQKSKIDGPCSRFHISRLKSGRLLLINHFNFKEQNSVEDIMNQGDVKAWKGRTHLTALLSEDDGKTWPYSLLLDERDEVSYPDAKEADDGYIYVTYDRQRITEREILMARFTEDDVLSGKLHSPDNKLKVLVNKALGQPNIK